MPHGTIIGPDAFRSYAVAVARAALPGKLPFQPIQGQMFDELADDDMSRCRQEGLQALGASTPL
jgi:hypothetical protein